MGRCRREHALGAAVRELHGLPDQPHDVAGQLRHLGVGERDARHEVVLLREAEVGIHQRRVLILVGAVAVQVAAAGVGRSARG